MDDSLAGVVLAAGAGSRLEPITKWIPKPLCPVANRPLLDWALDRLGSVTGAIAVNAHHHVDQIRASVPGSVHVSHEFPVALGTAGAVAALRPWIDGRPTLVVNGDTWGVGGVEHLVQGWDGTTVRVLVPGGGPFGPRSQIAGTLLPWWAVQSLDAQPSGLYEVIWKDAHDQGRLEVVDHPFPIVDCATPDDLLRANLDALGGESVIGVSAAVTGEVINSSVGDHAVVAGTVDQCVIFPHMVVEDHERLERVIRFPAGPNQVTLELSG